MKLSLRRKKKQEDAAVETEAPAEVEEASAAAKPAGGGAQKWLFMNVEKIVCFAVAGVLGLLIYSAVNKLKLDPNKTPDDLKKEVQQIKGQVANSPFPETRYPVPSYAEQAGRVARKVAAEDYTFGSLTGPTIIETTKRMEPKLFVVTDLEAKAGNGVFYVQRRNPNMVGMKLPAGGADRKPLPRDLDLGGVARPGGDNLLTEGRRWVSINARLPIAQQLAEYDRCFKNAFAYDLGRDRPDYITARIQRLEVRPGTPDGALDWTKAKVWDFGKWMSTVSAETSIWVGSTGEIVERRFVHPKLTMPLGPLAKSWKPWASHSTMPFAAPRPEPVKNRKGFARRAAPAPRQPQPKQVAAAPAAPPVDDDDVANIFGPPEEPEQQPEEPTEEPVVEEEPEPETVNKPVTHQLVRVFDFSVEPGKSYRYKIQLAVFNPNRKQLNIPARFLLQPETRDVNYRPTEWSDASNEVLVPLDAEIFAAGIEPSLEGGEETANLVVRILDVTEGKAPSTRYRLKRGSPVGGRATMMEVDAAERQLIVHSDVNLATDYTLIDLNGGQTLAGDLRAPADVLLLDSEGNLYVRSSAESESVTSQFTKLEMSMQAKPESRTPSDGDNGDDTGELFKQAGKGKEDRE